MTVSVETTRASYAGSGTAGPFPYPFKILSKYDLRVIKRAPDGSETTLTADVHYTVSGVGDDSGGDVTLLSALASGYELHIIRGSGLVQDATYEPNDIFPALSHEQALDKITMLVQEVRDLCRRSPMFRETSTAYLDRVIPDMTASALLGTDSLAENLRYYPMASMSVPAVDHIGNYSSLASAVSMIGSAKHKLTLNTSARIESDLVSPSTLSFDVPINGRFVIADGVEFTVLGRIEAGNYPIFECEGTGKVIIGPQQWERRVEWFGAVGAEGWDYTYDHDDLPGWRLAVQSCISNWFGGKIVYSTRKRYIWENGSEVGITIDATAISAALSTTWVTNESGSARIGYDEIPTIIFEGDAPPSRALNYASVDDTGTSITWGRIDVRGTGKAFLIAGNASATTGYKWRGKISIKNMRLHGNNTSEGGFYLKGVHNNGIFENVMVERFDGHGFDMDTDTIYSLHFLRCTASMNTGFGFVIDGNDLRFDQCISELNGGGGVWCKTTCPVVNWIGGGIQWNLGAQILVDAANWVRFQGVYIETQDSRANGTIETGTGRGVIELMGTSGTKEIRNFHFDGRIKRYTTTDLSHIPQYIFRIGANIKGLEISDLWVDDFSNRTGGSPAIVGPKGSWTLTDVHRGTIYNVDNIAEFADDATAACFSRINVPDTTLVFRWSDLLGNTADQYGSYTGLFDSESQRYLTPWSVSVLGMAWQCNATEGTVRVQDGETGVDYTFDCATAPSGRVSFTRGAYPLGRGVQFRPRVTTASWVGSTRDLNIIFILG